MTQWANFEIGWKRYQAAWDAYKAPIFSGGSYTSTERWIPSKDQWFGLLNPEAQTTNLPVPNIPGVWTSSPASEVWLAITQAFETVKVTWPDAIWNPNSHGWQTLRFVPATPTARVPLPPRPEPPTPLERARLQAQADRQRELDWANNAYAHREMDTETWIRTINDIEAKYRGRV